MATFRVGQRVRVVGPQNTKYLNTEAVVVQLGFWEKGSIASDGTKRPTECHYAIDTFDHKRWTVSSYQIEPLQHDGNTAITWDACCWRPHTEPENVI